MSAMMALFYLRLRKVGTEFSHETAASDYDDTFSDKLQQVIHVDRMALQSRTRASVQGHHLWHFKEGQSEDRIADSQTKSQSLTLIRSANVVANFISCGER